MKPVVLESPYAGNVEANVAYARKCLRDCLNRGEAPIASHLLYTQPGVLDENVLSEREWGISAGLAWAIVADYSVFYTDLGWSNGMRSALWKIISSTGFTRFRIRRFDKEGPWKVPISLDEEVEKLIISRCEA